jgi:hypothetical protein
VRQDNCFDQAVIHAEMGAGRMSEHGGAPACRVVCALPAQNGGKCQIATRRYVIIPVEIGHLVRQQTQQMLQQCIGDRIAGGRRQPFYCQRKRIEACADNEFVWRRSDRRWMDQDRLRPGLRVEKRQARVVHGIENRAACLHDSRCWRGGNNQLRQFCGKQLWAPQLSGLVP